MNRTDRIARAFAPLIVLSGIAVAAPSVEAAHLGRHAAAHVAGAPASSIQPMDSCIVRFPIRICINPR
jgi:hypothetical protein